MANKRVTIAEVAKAAGVSATAVSFAFNKPEQLNEETVSRILAAAHTLGYTPDPIARALISRGTGVIGVLFHNSIEATFANPFTSAFIRGIGQVCDESSLSVLIVSPIEGSLENAVSRAPVNGYIVLGLNDDHYELEPLRRRRVPFVVVDADASHVSSVNVEDYKGAYSAADYLLAKGHRDILIATFATSRRGYDDDQTYGVGVRRLAAYRDAFAKYGLPYDISRLVAVTSSFEGGADALSHALGIGIAPTAVLALSDAMAIGVLMEASRRGMRVPQDLEVIGFDDVPLAATMRPALSTVRQPIVEKGQLAARMLISALGGSAAREQVVLPTQLVLRESTRD